MGPIKDKRTSFIPYVVGKGRHTCFSAKGTAKLPDILYQEGPSYYNAKTGRKITMYIWKAV
jgi:hypothetical protein